MNFFDEFHARGKFERSLNATFISLISKKAGSMDIKDFQHICLMVSIKSSLKS